MTAQIPNTFEEASMAMQVIDQHIKDLTTYREQKAVEIAKFLRMNKGIELDPEAIKATLTRPYTVLPINEHEAWLIHWKGIRMPVMGWVQANEPAFIKSKITRSMEWFTPFPEWIKDEMGWKPPEHQAIIDGTRTGVQLTEGDEASFKRKYGQFLNGRGENGEFKIKGGDAWIKLVASLVRDGILPYQPKPVAPEHWDENAVYSPELMSILDTLEWKKKRAYLARAVEQFRQDGASTFNLPPGAGKSLILQMILTHLKGKTILFGDTKNLISQWERDLAVRVPNANVTLSTYQGAEKYTKQEWDFVIFDEAQRVPANSFSKLAFLKTHYRAGATGTAWREDQRQHLIVALCGKPFYIPWEELIAAGILRKPRVTVVTVPNEAAKTTYAKSLLAKRKGRAWIYCDWIEKGKAIADSLDVPFIHGETANGLQRIIDSEVCVVSRVADRGISMRDLRLVIEVAGQGKSREQFGQRLGRLLHGEFEGDFYTVFTPDEIQKYRSRIFGVEAELGGQVEIQFIEIGNMKDQVPQRTPADRKVNRVITRAAREYVKPTKSEPTDEIDEILSISSIAAKVSQAKKTVGVNSVALVERVIRYCWSAALSPKDIAEGLGMIGKNSVSELSSACKGVLQAGLMTVDDNGRYKVNHDEIERLKVLNQLRKK